MDSVNPSLPLATTADDDASAPIFKLGISRFLGPEYLPMFHDIVRMVCIQITIQLMLFLSGDSDFFTAQFLLLVVYIVLGVMMYWLTIRRIVSFD